MTTSSSCLTSFEETLHDLTEINRADLMREQRTMRDVTEKMSREIKDCYYTYSVEREAEDNPTTGNRWTKWDILLSFMEKQVEVSRRWVRNSPSSPTERSSEIKCHKCQKSGHIQRNCPDVKGIVNTVAIKDKQAEYGPCPACKGIKTYKPDRLQPGVGQFKTT